MEHGRRKGAVLTIRTVAETGSTNADMLDLARDRRGGGPVAARRAPERRARAAGQGVGVARRQFLCQHAGAIAPERSRRGNTGAGRGGGGRGCGRRAAVGLGRVSHQMAQRSADRRREGRRHPAGTADDAVVVGVGVNLRPPSRSARPPRPACGAGIGVAPPNVRRNAGRDFARWLARWRAQGLAPVRRALARPRAPARHAR